MTRTSRLQHAPGRVHRLQIEACLTSSERSALSSGGLCTLRCNTSAGQGRVKYMSGCSRVPAYGRMRLLTGCCAGPTCVP